MPDKSPHQLSFQWRNIQVRAIGVPALLVVLAAVVVIARLVALGRTCTPTPLARLLCHLR
jgi:hypothetical protein